MFDDLQPLVSLKFGKALESISRDLQAERSQKTADLASRGLSRSGPMAAMLRDNSLRSATLLCEALAGIWVDAIKKRDGQLSPESVNFVISTVQSTADIKAQQLAKTEFHAMERPLISESQAREEMGSVVSRIRRDLEIELREQELQPKPLTQSNI